MDFEKLEQLATDPNKRIAFAYELQQNAPELLRLARLGAKVDHLYLDEDLCDYGAEVQRYVEESRGVKAGD